MSKYAYNQTDDKATNSTVDTDAPDGEINDTSYVTEKDEPLQVQKDEDPVEDPIDARDADSDKQLGT